MAEIEKIGNRRRGGELLRGVFELLLKYPEGLPVRSVLEGLVQIVPPTSFEKTAYPHRPRVVRYDNNVMFVTIPAVKAGWLIKEKGVWRLTDAGHKAYKRFPDPDRFMREALQLYEEWKTGQSQNAGAPKGDGSSEDTALTLEEIEKTAWTQIETYLEKMSPGDFQELVVGLLQAMGCHVAWTSSSNSMRVVDIVAYTDPLGIQGPRLRVQVKQQRDKATVNEVLPLLTLLSEGDVGLFLSMGGFTSDVEEEIRREKRRVVLLDLKRFFDLWVKHYDRIPPTQRQLLPIHPVYFLVAEKDRVRFPNDDRTGSTAKIPSALRPLTKGKMNAKKRFDKTDVMGVSRK